MLTSTALHSISNLCRGFNIHKGGPDQAVELDSPTYSDMTTVDHSEILRPAKRAVFNSASKTLTVTNENGVVTVIELDGYMREPKPTLESLTKDFMRIPEDDISMADYMSFGQSIRKLMKGA